MVRKALIGEIADVDLRLLRIFRAVVDAGGFSAAELELNIGRSTVSRHVADLEGRLGFVLCTRGRGGFALTDEGRQVHEAAKRLLETVDGFRTDMHGLQSGLSGLLQLALFDKTATNPASRVADAIHRFRQSAPAVDIEVAVGTMATIESGVLEGRYHVGVVPDHRRSDALRYEPVFDEKMALYCGRSHPLCTATDVLSTIEDLRRFDYVGLSFHSPNMEATYRFGFNRRAAVTDQEAIATLVLSGDFIGFLPDHYAASFVDSGSMKRIELEGCQYVVEFVAISRRSPAPPRVAQAFLESLRIAHGTRG